MSSASSRRRISRIAVASGLFAVMMMVVCLFWPFSSGYEAARATPLRQPSVAGHKELIVALPSTDRFMNGEGAAELKVARRKQGLA